LNAKSPNQVSGVDQILRELGDHVADLAPKGTVPDAVEPVGQPVDQTELQDDTKSESD
jgi:hypothetical protein